MVLFIFTTQSCRKVLCDRSKLHDYLTGSLCYLLVDIHFHIISYQNRLFSWTVYTTFKWVLSETKMFISSPLKALNIIQQETLYILKMPNVTFHHKVTLKLARTWIWSHILINQPIINTWIGREVNLYSYGFCSFVLNPLLASHWI